MCSMLLHEILYLRILLDVALALHTWPASSVALITQSFNESINTSVVGSSIPSLNVSVGTEFGCSGWQYGWDLDVSSCLDALSQLDRRSTARQSWGPRRTETDYDIGLPRTYWSCK